MDADELRAAATAAIETLASYVEQSVAGSGPALARPAPADVVASLDLRRLLRDGGLDAGSFGPWLERYLGDGTRLHHPGELAHQVGVPDVGSAIADVVHGVGNQPMSIYEMGAAAAAVERAVLDWMVEKVGWEPESAGGVLTHGGSLANLTALLAARAKAAPDAWAGGVPADLAILAPPSAHYSIERAAGILGLGAGAIVPLEADALERIRVDRLPDALARTRAAGRTPIALVAAACATGTGLHDDVRGIGAFCAEHGSGFTSMPRTARPRCCPSGCAGCSTASSWPTRSCGTRTRCCARRRCARRCSCAAAASSRLRSRSTRRTSTSTTRSDSTRSTARSSARSRSWA